jgi:hypothetical protein
LGGDDDVAAVDDDEGMEDIMSDDGDLGSKVGIAIVSLMEFIVLIFHMYMRFVYWVCIIDY